MNSDIEDDIMDPVMQCITLQSHSSFLQKKLVSFVTEIHTASIDFLTPRKITVVILVRDRCPRGKGNLPRLPIRSNIVIPQTTAISNIKLPILKKEEYDIWAMEMEHYLEYIDNDVWKVIQNGNSKKRISTGKDGIVRILSLVTAGEIQAVEKERKVKNILLMAIPKEHMRRFHGMDDAKEI
ncbi:hypothetical protein Tco_0715805 [Tanacetum coccineum]